jgi:hypothetical protein
MAFLSAQSFPLFVAASMVLFLVVLGYVTIADALYGDGEKNPR